MKSYLAVDIGASSGRHMLGYMEDGRMKMEEIYRFPNGMTQRDGKLCWNVEELFGEIINGMKQCVRMGYTPGSMGIDTWGVDFVLLDEKDRLLGPAVGYRDGRTRGMDRKVYETVPEEELYMRTGIQKQLFNTVYQLAALREREPELLSRAYSLLMLPDYFHFLLTGQKSAEYTNATTTQLVNARTGQWDRELIERLRFPGRIFQKIHRPGTALGTLQEKIRKEVGFDCQVVLPATHDTGSAVLAMPCREDTGLYISSGTWSLMGTEVREAVLTGQAMKANLTNEGGYDRRFRLLKNIMGLWLIQSVRHEDGDAYSFAWICGEAEKNKSFPSRVNVNDDSFLAPESMKEAVKAYCRSTGQQVPDTPGQIGAVIYQSLAECYGRTIEEIEAVTGQTYPWIHIIGGGANADYLSQITAEVTGRYVSAGPTEATAIGNLVVQMMADGVFGSLKEAREHVRDSFGIKVFAPQRICEKGE